MRQLGAGNSIPVQTKTINTRNALRYGQLTLERIFAEIRASASHVGEVILSGGSPTPGGPPVFSATPGRFTVVADAAKILLRGGPMPLVRALEAAGHGARVAPLEASAAELAATVHRVGMLVRGAVGYWAGAETTRSVYRLVVQSRGQLLCSAEHPDTTAS